jgi:hypothetical protein
MNAAAGRKAGRENEIVAMIPMTANTSKTKNDPVVERSWSTVSVSFERRLRIRPVGVESKKRTGT